MKKLIKLLILSVAVVFFTGCNGTVDGSGSNNYSGWTNTGSISSASIDISNLTYGYEIQGYNNSGQNVTLQYCNGYYAYYRGSSESFYGYFTISGATVNMYDDDGGSYVIDTYGGYIEEGYNYYIYDVSDNITVTDILGISC